jgi:hypothetical protein
MFTRRCADGGKWGMRLGAGTGRVDRDGGP